MNYNNNYLPTPQEAVFYKDYVELYNKSVELDNEDYRNGGKSVNQERAHKMAGDWAKANLAECEVKRFMDGWYEFYYHMFD